MNPGQDDVNTSPEKLTEEEVMDKGINMIGGWWNAPPYWWLVKMIAKHYLKEMEYQTFNIPGAKVQLNSAPRSTLDKFTRQPIGGRFEVRLTH